MRSSMLSKIGGLRATVAFVTNIVLCLVLVSLLPIMWFWPFGGSYHPTVDVRDDAHLFRVAPLVTEIQKMEFRKEVHIVVVTIPKMNEAPLNEAVLTYARQHGGGASEWISKSNPNHWADGIMILEKWAATSERTLKCHWLSRT